MKYKGIELEGLDKKVKLSHSRVMETDEGTDWIDKLLTCDKAALTPTQFHEVSALSSVINMDYQICNGGIEQYVFNGYHEYRAPYSDDDVAQLDLNQQFIMLCRLVAFGGDVFPGMDKNEAVSARAGTSTATAMSALCASPRRWVSATSSASASWTPGTAPVARSMSSRARESSSCSTRIRASSSPSSWRVRVRSRVTTSLSGRMCRIG